MIARTSLKIKQDIIRARAGVHIPVAEYGLKLIEMVYKSKKELTIYLIDDNPSVRLAAKILIEQLEEK